MGFDRVTRFIERNVIEVAPLAFMRGRSLNDSFIILDEAQNTTVEQMKMFLTRIGFGSKAVVTGDITQTDLPHGKQSGPQPGHPRVAWSRGCRLHVLRRAGRCAASARPTHRQGLRGPEQLDMSVSTARVSDRAGAAKRAAGEGFNCVRVDVQRRVRTWAPPRTDLTTWATTALGRRAVGREIGVSVVGPAESRRLNARFRGRDKPTNVLSFPVAESPVAAAGEPRPRWAIW